MKNEILILDYSTDRSEAPAFRQWLPDDADVTVRFVDRDETSLADLDLSDVTHIIHSGSSLSITEEVPFTAAAEALIRNACESGIPQMGVCYGHQLLCRALVGPHAVRRVPNGLEVGWLNVDFNENGQELLGIGQSEKVWVYHFDEVTELPANSEIIASTPHTPIQGFLNRRFRMFGTQFHPEFDAEVGKRIFLEDKADLAKHGVAAEDLVRDAPSIDSGIVFFAAFLSMFPVADVKEGLS